MKHSKRRAAFDWVENRSTPEDLLSLPPALCGEILFTTLLINKFETALLRLKDRDLVWGPVHSSVGQEGIAAAAILALRKSDKITGSHRAHHQLLAKAVAYAVPDDYAPQHDELPAGVYETVYRSLAEIMGLAPGYCQGRGGSMHLRHAEAGVLGTNAIVGGGIPLATGAAFAEKHGNTGNVVVSFFGDGAVNQGSFHESCNLAGLWKLPVIFFLENNFYAVGTRVEKASAVDNLSVRAASYGMPGRVVNGQDLVAVYRTVEAAAESIRSGGGPVLIEVQCYRRYHHAGGVEGSAYGYRSKEEEQRWRKKDAVHRFPEALVKASLLSRQEVARIDAMALDCVQRALASCLTETSGDSTATGPIGPGRQTAVPPGVRALCAPEGADEAGAAGGSQNLSTVQSASHPVSSTADLSIPAALWPQVNSVRTGLRSDGSELRGLRFSERSEFTAFEELAYADIIAAVTGRWLEKDNRVFVLGEEVANMGGGAYRATRGLADRFPDRVLNTPISEAGFSGLALGAAVSGLRPVVEIMFPDFTLVAADQLLNQIPKLRYMYGDSLDVPLVARTRVAIGCGYGAQHSMDPVALYSLFPGWHIVVPSSGFDYVGLFNTAMSE